MEVEDFVAIHTGPMGLMDIKPPFSPIRLPGCCHTTGCHSMGLSTERAVVAFRGVEAAAGSSVEGEGSVAGKKKKAVA